ncbi:MAG: hypothetical protein ABSF98_16725 [Bryobacteraceae bacterium]|jgi:hypothetical protein
MGPADIPPCAPAFHEALVIDAEHLREQVLVKDKQSRMLRG